MVNDKDDATGYNPDPYRKWDPVEPLPQRDPFATLADWGRETPAPIDPDRYVSPGRAPWAPSKTHAGLILIGTVLILIAAVVGLVIF